MSPYALTLISLLLALLATSFAAALSVLAALRPPYRRAGVVMAIGFGLFALQHGYALELALRTGLFDLRQAALGAAAALLLLLGLAGLNRHRPETPPPR